MRAVVNPETPTTTESDADLNAAPRRNTMPGAEMTADAADLMASLPWWVSRGLLYVVGGFVFCAVLWACFANIDDAAVARGSIIPEGQIRPIQALEAGTVRSVDVHEGDKVVK